MNRKGKKPSAGGFLALPHAVLKSPNYRALSAHAKALLTDLGAQFRGKNNGDLGCAWTVMQPLGWKSRDTLSRAFAELLHYGLIEKTRQGGLNQCNLFALTWCAIDECKGKLDVPATRTPSGAWNIPRPPMPKPERKQNASTVGVSAQHGRRVNCRNGAQTSHLNNTAGVSVMANSTPVQTR